MKKKKEANSTGIKQHSKEERLTRRKAIKRIAAIFAGAAAGAGLTRGVSQAQKRYISAYTGPPPVYASSSGGYYSIVYYTSYRSHYTSVPPPYSSRR